MQRDNDEDAWRAIVENYGERVLGAEPAEDDPTEVEPVAPYPPSYDGPALTPPPPAAEPAPDPEDTFVPPPPPPLPRPSRDRLAAWAGVFGSPTLLLLSLVVGVPLPHWLAWILVVGFVGGFLYLVVQMPRGPQDPFDDGARL